MHTLILHVKFIGLVLTGLSFAAVAQTFPDFRYKIGASLGTTPILGGLERATSAAGKTNSQQEAIFNSSVPTLKYGQIVQLSVKVTDPTGAVKDYTAQPQLSYEGFRCLEVSSQGVVTVPVAPKDGCGLDTAELWVIYSDTAGHPVSYNTYMFVLTQ